MDALQMTTHQSHEDGEVSSTSTPMPAHDEPHIGQTSNSDDDALSLASTGKSSESTSKISYTWALKDEVAGIEEHLRRDQIPELKLGITWSELTVKAPSANSSVHENVFSQFNLPKLIREARRPAQLKTILDKSHGCVRPGEMLLVLGRPGAGCTTLLKMLSNRRQGYSEITGDVRFGSMDHEEAQKYRGQISMNTEEEIFYPTLTVGQTIDFATRMKTSPNTPLTGFRNVEEARKSFKDFLLRSVNIEHTHDTKIGDAFVRGVSGGERKRVSIIETLATRGSTYCWDNSTRGLDASTALEWARAIRALTDIFGLTTIVTLYQAGNGIYELFDKVLVLDEGKQIYYGPRTDALPFMTSQGFLCRDGSNIADFLTGVVVPTERAIITGHEQTFPRNANEIRAAYEKSAIYASMASENDFPDQDLTADNTMKFKAAVAAAKHKSLPRNSSLTSGFWTQVQTCVVRQYQILWGDKQTVLFKQLSTIAQALIAGSIFYNAPDTSAGLFLKGGALFFSLLYPALLAMSEVTDSYTGRPVLAKHRGFAFYHPSSFCIAQITADIPLLLIQISTFSLVLYFMVGLRVSASAFFAYWFVLFSSTMAMTALFRLIGAALPSENAAFNASGVVIMLTVLYTGYMIQKPQMHPWFVWVYWIDPLAYGFSALAANEFHNNLIPCVPPNVVPYGPEYIQSGPYQACSGLGGEQPNTAFLTGDDYLGSLSYSYSNMWRNVGILWVWWVLYVSLTIFFTSRWSQVDRGGYLLRPRETMSKSTHGPSIDVESNPASDAKGNDTAPEKSEDVSDRLVKNTSTFTWKNLRYTVNTPTGPRLLLNDVQGFVKPGQLGALMGSSGAGKTTLLDVLARRKTEGIIEGSILVDGRPLPISFQRSAGYCEQLDVHERYATVREALEFSALLRQSRETPDSEKLKYVDVIIDLLELHDIEYNLIGSIGAGLNVEQRKRVTIGVELVAKPSILLFLDEPTSGLDGQAAFNTVRCLRRLADAGQAILVTIHQPSAQLFSQFDTLLLLAKGGNTVYFGDIGDNATTVKDYFSRNGAPCPSGSNPAEHMIDVVSGSLSLGRDWAQIWRSSAECEKITAELDEMITSAQSRPPAQHADNYEFAMPMGYQTRLVTKRIAIALYRNTEYINNKVITHISGALVNGFSFWQIGESVNDLHLTLFTIFNFIFVAPGVIAQLQPLFLSFRDVYETREKKSKMYHWMPFVTGLVLSELPYLVVCAVAYFVCWYYTAGLPSSSSRAGATFFTMFLYELVYTSIGQFIAAPAPNAVFASLVNPQVIGWLVSFCGVLVPYAAITPFWRYTAYYINPFNYLMGSMLTFALWDKPINCDPSELAVFQPTKNQTCSAYLASYLSSSLGSAANLINPDATENCRVCSYTTGSDYLQTINLNAYYYGWRDVGVVGIFCVSGYVLVYALMKIRTKATKTAE